MKISKIQQQKPLTKNTKSTLTTLNFTQHLPTQLIQLIIDTKNINKINSQPNSILNHPDKKNKIHNNKPFKKNLHT